MRRKEHVSVMCNYILYETVCIFNGIQSCTRKFDFRELRQLVFESANIVRVLKKGVAGP